MQKARLIFLAALCGCASPPIHKPEYVDDFHRHMALSVLEHQTATLLIEFEATEATYWRDVFPVETILIPRSRGLNPKQVAWLVVITARGVGISPRLIARMINIENPWLVADTISHAGAVGLMQVMQFHFEDGVHDCGEGTLSDPTTNLCYGVDIFKNNLSAEIRKALERALNNYSGCVSTPGCELYASKVLQQETNPVEVE